MGLVNLLGGYPVVGGLIAFLACVALIAWDYIRFEWSGRWIANAFTVRRIGITLAVISMILMLSRFISVVSSHSGL